MEDFRRATGGTEKTMQRLSAYAGVLIKWQQRINLVGNATLPDLWRRHMMDSAQLFDLLPKPTQTLVDLGSGAGFPGLVLAILGVREVHLVESDGRKCAFLQEAARASGASVNIHRTRIEKMPPILADVVTARACAPLSSLVSYAQPFLKKGSICLFPKGRNAQQELTESEKKWIMTVTRIESLTDSQAEILKLQDIGPRHES
ncbi:MAG: 16S rRNA (guanine(527)-N(7))-methyltransferase RsmG [Alphaproteobacteria bacterium]|nr:16S rRNA (guanine(527)-N(7))-methyltransferase RsmG [Alphaproteobacteria bacterium]